MRTALIAALVALVAAPLAWSQSAANRPTTPQVAGSGPAWKSLSPAQREALAPLAGEWDRLDATRKQKWLEVATRYPQLSPDGKKHVHERMAEIVQLTPEQRRVMRENFKRAYELPPEQRELRVQGFQQLPEERRRELAESAKPATPVKAEPPRKPTRDLLAPADPTRPAQ